VSCRIENMFVINRLSILFLIICSLFLTTDISVARSNRDKPIMIGVALDVTGRLAFAGHGILEGLNAYFAHFNKLGGVHGRPIKLVVYDNESSYKYTLSNIQRLAEVEKVHIILGPSRYLSAVSKYAHRAGDSLIIPFIPFFGKTLSPKFFSLLPSYTTQAVLAVDLIIEKLKKDRISVIYRDSEYGRKIKSTLAERLRQHGKEMVTGLSFSSRETDLSPHVMKLIESKTEAVVVFGTTEEAVLVLKASFNMDSGLQSLIISPLEDRNLLIEDGGRAAEGAIACSIFPDPSYGKAPGIKNFRKILRDYNSEIQPDSYNLMGFTYANVVSEVLRRAESITFKGLTKAFESLKSYDTGIIPQISFGKEDRQAYNGAYFSTVKGLKWVTSYETNLFEVYIRIKSVPNWADVLEETHWGNLGNTGKDGFFKKDVCWRPGTYIIKVRKGSRAKKKSFYVDKDPKWIDWTVDLLSK